MFDLLPDEIVLSVVMFLPLQSVVVFSLTNLRHSTLVSSNESLKMLARKHKLPVKSDLISLLSYIKCEKCNYTSCIHRVQRRLKDGARMKDRKLVSYILSHEFDDCTTIIKELVNSDQQHEAKRFTRSRLANSWLSRTELRAQLLFHACKVGSVDEVTTLLAKYKYLVSTLRLAVKCAVREHREDIVELLITNHNVGNAALIAAAEIGNIDLVLSLILPVNLMIVRKVAEVAIASGHTEVVDYLVDMLGFEVKSTLLTYAISSDTGLEYVLSHCGKVTPRSAMSALLATSSTENCSAFHRLHPFTGGNYDLSACLSSAIKHEQLEYVTMLIEEYGVIVTEEHIRYAVETSNLTLIQQLLSILPVGCDRLVSHIRTVEIAEYFEMTRDKDVINSCLNRAISIGYITDVKRCLSYNYEYDYEVLRLRALKSGSLSLAHYLSSSSSR